ncbi:TPA: helix-turn-helix domain-containing protein [Candidatus Scatousia excrementigallinarum]|uniref:Helix-turn-helix domain-containing protein n=1 Tax=Candidatus Scatousia excrementigallinarum TaxID=2840935 RepID=A0A9D1JM39_9BACT|nr:helix-turn-helix domain-containing protein [Candidatus Scatousia excrementigallinarum]
MSEYLSKEEIKQWRSSLEKITLEEFAARLGKKIEEAKPTNDLIDIVLQGKPVMSTEETWLQTKGERISTIAQRAFDREQEIAPSPFSISKIKIDADVEPVKPPKSSENKTSVKSTKTVKAKSEKTPAKKTAKTVEKTAKVKSIKAEINSDSLREEVRIVFKKALTDREQKVFDHFAKNKNQVVYAKDLATLLDLPRDYVYKYIKNLRAKIEGEKLENAEKGGFILHV